MIGKHAYFPKVYRIKIRKLVFWHRIFRVVDKSLVKIIHDEQKRTGLKNRWYNEICDISSELDMQLSETEISSLKEKELLKITNVKVNKKINSANGTNENKKIRSGKS